MDKREYSQGLAQPRAATAWIVNWRLSSADGVLAAADHLPRPALHGRRALPGRHASIIKVKACGSVLSKNLLEGNSENPLEVEHVPIVRAELLLEGRPRNEGGLLRFDPVKALSKPKAVPLFPKPLPLQQRKRFFMVCADNRMRVRKDTRIRV